MVESNPGGGPGGQDPGHVHGKGCGCAEQHKNTDKFGIDLFDHVDMDAVDCFNEKHTGKIRTVIRSLEDKLAFDENREMETESDYGPELVVFVPFKGDMRIKAICVIGEGGGQAPSSVKLYRNVDSVDCDIIEDRKEVQKLDLSENPTGEVDSHVNASKFNNVHNIVLGFDKNFGAPTTKIRFIGIKGEMIRTN